MKKIYILVFLLFFISCKENIETIKLPVKKNITFNLGFNLNHRFSGSFYDKKSKSEIIYFAEPVTKKKIKFFDINGSCKDSINLESLSKVSLNINSLKIISKDTLLFFDHNDIYLVNSLGQIWKRINLMDMLKANTSRDVYEMADSYKTNTEFNGKTCFLGLSWIKNGNKNLSNKDYFIEAFDKPSIVKLNNFFTDTVSYMFNKTNHYRSWYNEPKFFSEGFNYRQVKNNAYIFSFFSNEILQFDIKNLKVLKNIPVISDYTSIGKKPLDIDVEEISSKEVILRSKMAGAITDIFYLPNKKCFYVIVRHEINKEDVDEEFNRPFSFIKYDENFNKMNETVINNSKMDYIGYNIIQTKQGLMIQKNTKQNEKAVTYSLLK